MSTKLLKIIIATILTAILVAFTYHLFEDFVHSAIDFIWLDIFNTNEKRLFVIPLSLILGLLFFGIQELLDSKSENNDTKGLGEIPSPNIINFLKIILLGFLSLIAGASLGPEAVLVPACILIGLIVSKSLFSQESKQSKYLAGAGFTALMTAFFGSFIIGLLSIFLLKKELGLKVSKYLIIIVLIATATSKLTLNIIESKPYFNLPQYTYKLSIATLLLILVIAFGGYYSILLMSKLNKIFNNISILFKNKSWYIKAAFASLGIALLYLLGGTLVEFTGNKSIIPMFEQAKSLGLIGLVWVLIIKIAVISWSKSWNYRGGMIFPTIFVASVLVAIIQLFFPSFNIFYGLIAALIGAFIANKKTNILL